LRRVFFPFDVVVTGIKVDRDPMGMDLSKDRLILLAPLPVDDVFVLPCMALSSRSPEVFPDCLSHDHLFSSPTGQGCFGSSWSPAFGRPHP